MGGEVALGTVVSCSPIFLMAPEATRVFRSLSLFRGRLQPTSVQPLC